MLDYVVMEDHEQIHDEQEALIQAEADPAEFEIDEAQTPVSAKEELKFCLLLCLYFVRSYRDAYRSVRTG